MSLLNQAVAGSREAWEQIVFLYSPLVYAWCRRRHLKEQDIHDLGQDVFLTLYTKLNKFEKTEPNHSFRRWLKTLTNRKVTDFYRARMGLPDVPGGTFDPATIPDKRLVDPPDPDEGREEASDLVILMRRCLEMVRPDFEARTWDAFQGVVVENRTPAEVAASLNMTTGSVYLAKSRILRRLRETLDRFEESSPIF